jgi:hypothetical protein
MYNSIPNNLSNLELTTVAHYVIKMLNKYKSKENRDVKLNDLPFRSTDDKLLLICNNLLNEINIEELKENDTELDYHINKIFSVLQERLKNEVQRMKSQGEELLRKFKMDDN